MEAVCASEMSVHLNDTARHYIPEDCDLQHIDFRDISFEVRGGQISLRIVSILGYGIGDVESLESGS
jgi:hypothetical protein